MPVKIRLTRMGKKKQPSYRVVVVDSRRPRDGAHIEQIGRYDPRQDPSIIEIDNDRALKWLQDGAQPTDRARKLLEISGAWARFRIARGEIHTVGDAPAAPDQRPEPAAVEEALADSAIEASVEADGQEDAGGDESAPEAAGAGGDEDSMDEPTTDEGEPA